MRQLLGSLRLTFVGWVVLALVAAAILLFVFGPSSIQVPALIVAVLLLLVVIGNTFSWGGAGGLLNEQPPAWNREAVEKATSEFEPRERGEPDEHETSDPQAWQHERERRAEIDRERAG